MPHLLKTIVFIVSTMILASCGSDELTKKLIPEKESGIAEKYLIMLKDGNYDEIKNNIHIKLKPQLNDKVLEEMTGYFREGEILSTEIIGSQVNLLNNTWTGNFTFEYHFTSGWNLASVALKKNGTSYEIIGVNVYQTKDSQKNITAFTLSGKTVLHYLVLFFTILVPIFIIVSTIYCIRTPIPKRKWLWIVFVLIGIVSIKLNWVTGQYAIQPISFRLFGASFTAASVHAPWLISVSFPLGAIMFWMKRKGFIEKSKEKQNA